MKTMTKFAFAVSAILASFSMAQPTFAQSTSGYEWRTDDTGTYLFVTGTHPVRIYAKDVRDIRIVEEIPAVQAAPAQPAPVQAAQTAPVQAAQTAPVQDTPAVQTVPNQAVSALQNGVDPLSPFGPREKFLQYYKQLNDVEKQLYETVYFASLNHEDSCHFDGQVENVARVIWAVHNDHPELFWLDRSYSVMTSSGIGTSYDFKLKYLDLGEPLEQSKRKVDAVINVLVQEASKLSSDAEKERFVHDYLVMNTNYDKSCSFRHSEYGALVNRCAVCEGFSHAFQHIMLKLGIPATYIPGVLDDENGVASEHAWNQIILDGQCYNIDVTADEFPPDEDFRNKQKLALYIYYNLSDREFESHGYRRDSDVKTDEIAIPVCKQSAHIENLLGMDGLIKAFSYFNMNVDNAIKTIDDYYSLMYNEIVQSKTNSISVYALIKGEKLYSKINNLSMKEKKKGYLSEAWKKSFNAYSSASTSLTMYRVSPNVWLSLTEVTFSK